MLQASPLLDLSLSCSQSITLVMLGSVSFQLDACGVLSTLNYEEIGKIGFRSCESSYEQ